MQVCLPLLQHSKYRGYRGHWDQGNHLIGYDLHNKLLFDTSLALTAKYLHSILVLFLVFCIYLHNVQSTFHTLPHQRGQCHCCSWLALTKATQNG